MDKPTWTFRYIRRLRAMTGWPLADCLRVAGDAYECCEDCSPEETAESDVAYAMEG